MYCEISSSWPWCKRFMCASLIITHIPTRTKISHTVLLIAPNNEQLKSHLESKFYINLCSECCTYFPRSDLKLKHRFYHICATVKSKDGKSWKQNIILEDISECYMTFKNENHNLVIAFGNICDSMCKSGKY